MTDEITPELYSNIRSIAYSRCKQRGKPELFEDAAQEGAIKAWEASQREVSGDRSAYLIAAATNGVKQVLRGNPFTGQETWRGKKRNDATWKADHLDEDGWSMLADDFVYEDPDPFHSETFEAIARCLTKRQKFIFVARFAWGETWDWVVENLPGKKKMTKYEVQKYWREEVWPWIQQQVALAA